MLISKHSLQKFYTRTEYQKISSKYTNIIANKPSNLKHIYSSLNKSNHEFQPESRLQVIKTEASLRKTHEKIYWALLPSLFGKLFIARTLHGLCGMAFCDEYGVDSTLRMISRRWTSELIRDQGNLWLFAKGIFSGSEVIPIHLLGTPFQTSVWQNLIKVPYGTIDHYASIANNVGKKSAVRAVGSAIGANPIAWLIPCHRIISSNYFLSGYNWGLEKKAALLSHEKTIAPQRLFELQYGCLNTRCKLNSKKVNYLEDSQ